MTRRLKLDLESEYVLKGHTEEIVILSVGGLICVLGFITGDIQALLIGLAIISPIYILVKFITLEYIIFTKEGINCIEERRYIFPKRQEYYRKWGDIQRIELSGSWHSKYRSYSIITHSARVIAKRYRRSTIGYPTDHSVFQTRLDLGKLSECARFYSGRNDIILWN